MCHRAVLRVNNTPLLGGAIAEQSIRCAGCVVNRVSTNERLNGSKTYSE